MRKMRSRALVVVIAAFFALPAGAHAGHFLDHAAPSFSEGAPSTAFQSGGPGATWELLRTFPTGNPHTDLDFFRRNGDLYASVGTLAIGPNGGGQTIFKLMEDGEVVPSSMSHVFSHPSASCLSNPAAATGLQHDVEATPKGGTILNSANPYAATGDAEVLIDATDADGRCHDQAPTGRRGRSRAASRSSTSRTRRTRWRSASSATSARHTRSTWIRSARTSSTPRPPTLSA